MGQEKVINILERRKEKWFSVKDLTVILHQGRSSIFSILRKLYNQGNIYRKEEIVYGSVVKYLFKFKKR
jgi:predicted transcriptional regulator